MKIYFEKYIRVLSVVLLMLAILIINTGNAFAASNSTLPVIGNINNPSNGQVVSGNVLVSGWFLDINGVAKIEILVDGTLIGQVSYGDLRQDIVNGYPQYNNSNSGYHYSLDTTKISNGAHTIIVRETSVSGGQTNLTSTISVFNNILSPKGGIDCPLNAQIAKETQQVSGWFLDGNGVSKIEVFVDGILNGQAIDGDSRPDIGNIYPQYNNSSSGFHYNFDTAKLSYGPHILVIRETGNTGLQTSLTTSIVSNKSFGQNLIENGNGEEGLSGYGVGEINWAPNTGDLVGQTDGTLEIDSDGSFKVSTTAPWRGLVYEKYIPITSSPKMISVTAKNSAGTYFNIAGRYYDANKNYIGYEDSGTFNSTEYSTFTYTFNNIPQNAAYFRYTVRIGNCVGTLNVKGMSLVEELIKNGNDEQGLNGYSVGEINWTPNSGDLVGQTDGILTIDSDGSFKVSTTVPWRGLVNVNYIPITNSPKTFSVTAKNSSGTYFNIAGRYYDANKNYIGYEDSGTFNSTEYSTFTYTFNNIPQNAAYFRYNVRIGNCVGTLNVKGMSLVEASQ